MMIVHLHKYYLKDRNGTCTEVNPEDYLVSFNDVRPIFFEREGGKQVDVYREQVKFYKHNNHLFRFVTYSEIEDKFCLN